MSRELISASDRAILASAKAIRGRLARERKQSRPPKAKPDHAAPGQRDPRELDAAYMAWQHAEGLSCVACQITGSPQRGPIEVAHQKLAIAAKGWRGAGKGSRGHDRNSVPLCRWHHQDAPDACDKAQRKFWDRHGLGDEIADLCAELYAAFKAQEPGAPVIARWVAVARRRLAEHAQAATHPATHVQDGRQR